MMWMLIPMIGVVLAAVLGLIIGCEREFFGKAAGIRTNTLVAAGSALFTEISRYGFLDGAASDPARVAAQIVTGVGFLGAGLIFVRRDAVVGLTTAAGIWFTAGVGMASGAGLYAVAVGSTVMYLIVMVGIRPLENRLPRSASTQAKIDITYADGRGVLRRIIELAGLRSLKVVDFTVVGGVDAQGTSAQRITVAIFGSRGSIEQFRDQLAGVPGVLDVADRPPD
ncbi:MAG: MgtC/SapB family protein [Propionibacteriaceae bacterium]|jgi:putative Mg2+ transporter-C (MgtC) family protein|nr:MgtC/SapB family protein [Propionibacteriaceae bacterium]